MNFKLMILASDPILAVEAQNAGVDRVFFDLEYINKSERQKGRNTVLSDNNVEDIPSVRNKLNKSELLVRVNPINQYSKAEIDKVIEYGADIVMLPMAFDKFDVHKFIKYVGGRAKTCVMIETTQALTRVDDILEVQGIDELFFGLNDLHIGLGLPFLFEVLSGGLVAYLASKCRGKGIPFGFGGIAKVGEGILPADKILGEHIRLGSSSVILSRTFKGITKGNQPSEINLKEEVDKVKYKIQEIELWSEEEFNANRIDVKDIVSEVVNN